MAMLTCCCPGCRTGYPDTKRSKNDNDPILNKPKYSLHIFPKDEELRRKWLRAINREHFVPSKYSRVCSRHFEQSWFRSERRDKNIYRSRTKAAMPLRINVLKPDAVPTIFPDAPNIITSLAATPTMINNSAPIEERTVEEKSIIHGPDTIFVVLEDAIIRFEDIQEKLDRSVMPPGVHVLYGSDSAVFMALSSTQSSLEIMYGLKVNQDLSYQVFLNGSLVSYHEVHHICPSKFIRCISDIYNIIAFLRNGRDVSPPGSGSNIQRAMKLLESSKAEEREPGVANKLGFIIEQLGLHAKKGKSGGNSGGFVFSHELLQVANAWQNTDPALYNQILESDLMFLPSASILKKYNGDINAFHAGVHQSVKIEYTIDQ